MEAGNEGDFMKMIVCFASGPWASLVSRPMAEINGKGPLPAPKMLRVCRSGLIAARMKEGPIGRGRGSMSAEQFAQAQQQIERNKAAPQKTY